MVHLLPTILVEGCQGFAGALSCNALIGVGGSDEKPRQAQSPVELPLQLQLQVDLHGCQVIT